MWTSWVTLVLYSMIGKIINHEKDDFCTIYIFVWKKNKWISVTLYKLIFICNKKMTFMNFIILTELSRLNAGSKEKLWREQDFYTCMLSHLQKVVYNFLEYGLWSTCTDKHVLHLKLIHVICSFSFIASIPSTMIPSQDEAPVLLYRPLLYRSTINWHCSSAIKCMLQFHVRRKGTSI